MDMVIAPLTGSIGDVMTVTSINAAFQGTPFGTAALIGFANPTTTLTYTKLAAAAASPIPLPMKVGADVYDGTANLAVRFDCNNPAPAGSSDTWEGFNIPNSQSATSLLVVAYVKFANGPDPDQAVSINNDWINISGDRGFAVSQQVQLENGLSDILHGHSEGELGNTIAVDPTKTYQLLVFYNDVDSIGQYLLLDGSTVVGASDSLMAGSSGTVTYMLLQNYLTNRTGYTYFYLVGLNWTSPTFPNRAITVPDVTGMGLVQIAIDTLTLSFNSVVTRFNIEVTADGGAHWTLIESNLRIQTVTVVKSYVDAGVSDGQTYQFRVAALIGSQVSGKVTSGAVTVNNGPFLPPTWTDAIDISATDTTETNGAALRQSLVCGTTGSCVKLRVGCRNFGVATGFKLALYDSSNNLLGNGTAVSAVTTSGSWFEITLDTPVNVTSGTTYKIGAMPQSSAGIQTGFLLLGGGALIDFTTTYPAFPPDPYSGVDGVPWTVAVGMGVV